MSNQIVISSGAKVRALEGVLTGTAGIVNALGINVPNGIPQLDGSGKILVSQLPNSVMEYKGTWNAATNTPTLVNGTGNQGDVYLCNVAGTVDFGAGPIVFFVGDQVIYSGTIWQRASGASGTVTSVAVTESGDALTITGSPITTSGTINIGFAGTSGQYINGAGGLTSFPSLTGFVPYTGATANLDLGTFNLTADVITGATGSFASSGGSNTFDINHSSGSGIALNITKGGNGEGLYINKTSGSGNAATIIGTLNATTLVKSGGTSSQFLKADGSVDASAYITLTSLSAGAGISYNNTTGAISSTITQYTDALARASVSLTTTGTSGAATYNSTTGVFNIPNYTPDLSAYVTLATTQTITGSKTFSNPTFNNGGISLQNGSSYSSSGYMNLGGLTDGLRFTSGGGISNYFNLPSSVGYTYTFPAATGTLALTSNLSAYLPLAGGTLTGALSGTTATFSSSVTANSLIKTGGTSAQILAADGSVITAGTNITISGGTISTSGSGITGSGTTNYIPKFTGASSIGNSLIFDNGTNIGIGLTSPSYKLDVQDNGVSGIVDVASFSVTGNGGSGRGVGILLGAAGSSNSVQVARLVGYHELAISSAVASSFAIQVANSSGVLTERLRISQAGNLIIGTTGDAGFKLNVNGTGNFSGALTGTSATFSSSVGINGGDFRYRPNGDVTNSPALVFKDAGNSALDICAEVIGDANAASRPIAFRVSNVTAGRFEAMRITNTGNLGLGVTPSAWYTGYTALQVGFSGSIFSNRTSADTNTTMIGNNAFLNSAATNWIYQNNGFATRYTQVSGGHEFYTAASGTAGNAITWGTAKMTITSGGNVGIGTSSPYSKLDVSGGISINGRPIIDNSSAELYIGGITGISGRGTDMVAIYTSNSEKVRITSGGNVGIGTSSPTAKLSVNANAVGVLANISDGIAETLQISTGSGYVSFLNPNSGVISFRDSTNTVERMRITSGGVITIANLAGTGSRAVLADASGNLSAPISDISVKENIKPIGYGLNEILQMNPVWFDFIEEYKNYGEGRQNGMIAQEVAEVIPEAVFVTPSTGKMGINYDQLHGVYIKAIQELKLEIEQLKNK
jgi:hypothetical protein